MADEWPTVASEYQIIEQIGQVRTCPVRAPRQRAGAMLGQGWLAV